MRASRGHHLTPPGMRAESSAALNCFSVVRNGRMILEGYGMRESTYTFHTLALLPREAMEPPMADARLTALPAARFHDSAAITSSMDCAHLPGEGAPPFSVAASSSWSSSCTSSASGGASECPPPSSLRCRLRDGCSEATAAPR